MKGNEKVIEALQSVLTAELTAINQYFIHAEMCENWGMKKLAGLIKQDSIQEMKHAEVSIERMLFLESSPDMTKPMQINVGQALPEMFKSDLALEYEAVANLNKLIAVATTAADNGTRDLFLTILKDEEEHVDWLETQLSMIEQMGLQNYIALQTA